MNGANCASPAIGRRAVLAGAVGSVMLQCGMGGVSSALAQTVAAPAASVAEPFDFDRLTAAMQDMATRPAVAPVKPDGFHTSFDYDDYRAINFDPARARWSEDAGRFRLAAFHLGWLFAEPVQLFEIIDGLAQPLTFSTDDFLYYDRIRDLVPQHAELAGVAGFRLSGPLNRPDVQDEVVAFLGASYFRAVGRGNTYGLSARGLAIDTALGRPEEFPRFTRFWLQRPTPSDATVTVYAALESHSCTGAYRFVIRPGLDTAMDVTARLFFRHDVGQVGLAPLTSMFLYSEKNRAGFDDYRPNVHDSDGLMIRRRDGDVIWRPLNNPPRLSESWFTEDSPRAFGLMQRDRAFASYQDASAHYERRPSLLVEPLSDWGRGAIRLVELPTDSEANDNIVAFWVPSAPLVPGQQHEFAYRLHWGAQTSDASSDLAYIRETRSGAAGVAGADSDPNARKFVVDFAGGLLAALPADAAVQAMVTVSGGEILFQALKKVDGSGDWRLVIDVAAPNGALVEMSAHIAGFDRKLTELWLYQWVKR